MFAINWYVYESMEKPLKHRYPQSTLTWEVFVNLFKFSFILFIHIKGPTNISSSFAKSTHILSWGLNFSGLLTLIYYLDLIIRSFFYFIFKPNLYKPNNTFETILPISISFHYQTYTYSDSIKHTKRIVNCFLQQSEMVLISCLP